ncbi:MAG: hypothetical protein M1834_001520 [Cirrosporium novae-zelandiae]|nr:MAG: hypothetical protein M1834_004037 [Cirrosporium novae-zelandiae]KAI9735505.1 MAG: hypothetical protein M1834_001520 [Cirrosporium novae-zelandiae]
MVLIFIVLALFFNSQTTGRVIPLGAFSGFDDSIEYFRGLAPIPTARDSYIAFTKGLVVEFINSCPEVAASTGYFYMNVANLGSSDDGKLISVLKQTAFWLFDSTGAVMQYDAWVLALSV